VVSSSSCRLLPFFDMGLTVVYMMTLEYTVLERRPATGSLAMTEPPKHRTPHAASYIPVIAPRPTRSTLPSSLSLPQLQLAPLPRRPSGSSPAVAASPVSSSVPHTGISSFRSLRNLLPFGAAKSNHSAGATGGTPNAPKSSFPNFGSVRRSMTSDRKNSATFLRAEEEEPSPVISIEASPQHTDTDTDYDTLAYDSRSSSGDHINFSPASRKSSDTSEPDHFNSRAEFDRVAI
jgi:hypothetical protein